MVATRPTVLLLCVAFTALSGAPCAAKEAAPRRPFVMHPGVVVDPVRPALYVTDSRGQAVEALVPDTGGTPRWRSERAVRPITVHGGRLVAQAASDSARLALVSLDADDPEKDPRRAEMALPDGVHARLQDGLGASFRIEGRAHGDVVVVHWTYMRRTVSGMPTRGDKAFRAEGYASFDPRTGALKKLTAETAPRDPMAHVPELVPPAGRKLDRMPWRAGDVWIHIARRTGEQGEKLIVVFRWNPDGTALPERHIEVEDWLVELESRDGRHLNAVVRLPTGTPPAGGYRWTIYSLETGKKVDSFRSPSSASTFAVVGKATVSVAQPVARVKDGKVEKQPLRLHGRTPNGIWAHAIFDTRYHGPMPPGSGR